MDLNWLKSPQAVEELTRKLNATHIGHELVMTDNVHSASVCPDEVRTLSLYPVKMVGAMIIMCIQGSISYKINLSRHTAVADDIIVILPGSIIQIDDASGDVRLASISFAAGYYEDVVDASPQMRDFPVIHLSQSDFQECLEIYYNLKKRIEKSNVNLSKSVAQGYLKVMCSIIFDHWRRDIKIDDQKISQRTRLYRMYLAKVQEDYREHRSLQHYADSLCVTPKYLSMVVKLVSGRNASEFIDELVLFESKSLLMDQKYSIQQVSDMMNFPNPSFFAKFFKQRCGITPSAYRKLNAFHPLRAC